MARIAAVRETLQIGFPGGTYEQLFYVADVKIARGFDRDLHINLGEHILALMFPVRSSGMQRLIGLVPPDLSGRGTIGFEDIRGHVEPLFDITSDAGELVRHVSRSPSRGREVPSGASVPCGRRGPHT